MPGLPKAEKQDAAGESCRRTRSPKTSGVPSAAAMASVDAGSSNNPAFGAASKFRAVESQDGQGFRVGGEGSSGQNSGIVALLVALNKKRCLLKTVRL